MKLYYPVKPWLVTQRFGETAFLSYYATNGVNVVGHNGMDILTTRGQPIYAAHDGVCYPEVDNKQGHGVVLRSVDKFDYNGQSLSFKTIYWHLIDNIPVKTGQAVKAGEIIGYSNSTGLSSGDHLHFGLKPVGVNEANGAWFNTEQNNGYQGAIDPEPYFNKEYAVDIGKPTSNYFNVNLQRGSTGEEVKKLQKFLVGLGYLSESEVIGIYGPRTQNAVFMFQMNFVTPLTWSEQYVYQGRYWGPKSRKVANLMQTT